MRREHFEVGETAVTIVADDEYLEVAHASIFRSREILQRFIRRDPFFQVTLEPYPCPDDAPALIVRMGLFTRIFHFRPWLLSEN